MNVVAHIRIVSFYALCTCNLTFRNVYTSFEISYEIHCLIWVEIHWKDAV